MKVAFILPMPTFKVVGGYKIVYEYANFLNENGYDITIIYDSHKGTNSKKYPAIIVFLIRLLIGKFGPFWFELNKGIKKKIYYDLSSSKINDYNVIVATAAETAIIVNKTDAKKVYFVQDYEDWHISEKELWKTYNYDMNIVTIARWLQDKIESVSDKTITYIPNGINAQIFKAKIEYSKRKKHSISMLYHKDVRKGCDIGIQLILKLKKVYPDLEVYMFGSPKREKTWPDWIFYKQNASQQEVCDIMNKSALFICTSRSEGFGLTGLESLFSGCVLVTTDCKGVREYADESNAFIVKVDDFEGLFNAVCVAFEDENLCIDKLNNLTNTLNKFNSDNSKNDFKNFIEDL